MERGRRRSSSFHSDYDEPDDCAPPLPLPETLGGDVTNSSDEASGPSVADADEDTFETLVRSRSRSKSVHDSDQDISNQIVASATIQQKDSGKGESRTEPKELAGPIQSREFLALQKGLEEASEKKNEQQIKEEQAEIEAAARERIKRASGTSIATIGSDPPAARKVKILVLGDSGVGKSCIINRYVNDSFSPSLVSTLGVDLKSKRVHVDDRTVQVQVWDTAGQTAFHKITTSYYRGSNAILLVYDVSDRATWTNIEYWMKNIREQASENVHVALIGNKTDLRGKPGHETYVRTEEGRSSADKYHVAYTETSAMTSGVEIDEAFMKIIRSVLNAEDKKKPGSDGSRSPESVQQKFISRPSKVSGEIKNDLVKITEESHETHVGSPDGKDKKCIVS